MAYCTKTDLDNFWGSQNIIDWSNVNNTSSSANTTRINQAISWADEQINNRLRLSRYVVPFATVPEHIKHISVRLAGAWLYEARGYIDTDEDGRPIDRMGYFKREAFRDIERILRGEVRLTTSKAVSHDPTVPHL